MSRVLLLVPRMNIGGAETYVFTVAKGLKQRGHEVFVASAGGQLADKLETYGIKTIFLPVRFNIKLAAHLLSRIVKKYAIDIIHANSGDAGCVAALVKRQTNIKVVYTAHGLFGDYQREYIINEVDKIICVSNFVKQKALAQNFTESKLVTCYCGVDLERFTANQDVRAVLRKKYGISEDTLVLAIVSRIKNLSHKGHQDLFKILKDYAPQADWRLMVIGKGKGLLKLKWTVYKMGLQQRVLVLGHRTDVEYLLNMADLLVLPTNFETFGLVLAEAMAMQKPAIAYSVGGTPEVINDGQTGYLIEHHNLQAMYKRIKYLDEHRDVLKKMSTAARSWVAQNFDNKTMLDQIENIYQEVLSK